MASRAGPRAIGSDGSDFQHRERVANHYQESVAGKMSIKKSLIPHMFLTVLGFGRILSLSLGIQYFNPPEMWELMWLMSGLCAYIGYGSLAKNLEKKLLAYIIGNISFGLAPLVYGASLIIKECLNQYREKVSFSEWKDAPIKLAFISVCLQVQLMGIYNGIKLFKVWSARANKSE